MRRLSLWLLALLVNGAPLHAADPWHDARVVETLRIGELDGADEYLFGRIGDIAVGPDGAIYVADHQTITVRHFGPDGRYVRDIGRIGEGPGEYRQFLGMKCLRDGQLVVFASHPNHILIYGPDGGYRNRITFLSCLAAPDMLEYDVDGHIYAKELSEPPSADEDWRFVLLEMSQLGDTLGWIELPKPDKRGFDMVVMTAQGPIYPFTVQTCYAWSPLGYLVVGRNDEYSLALVDKKGREFGRINRTFEAIPVTKEERQDWQDWLGGSSRDASGVKQSIDLPDTKPVFRHILAGDDGRIWVSRYVPAEKRTLDGDPKRRLEWREPTTFDVFEPDGLFLGTIVIPRDVAIGVWRGHEMWGVFTGDEGQQVVRYRIDP